MTAFLFIQISMKKTYDAVKKKIYYHKFIHYMKIS